MLFILQVCIISLATIGFTKMGKSALVAYVGLLFTMANLFVIKQIAMLDWIVTSSDAFIIGISFSINLLQEFWDRDTARKTLWISFALSLFYMVITKCIMLYEPASVDEAHTHLAFVMANTTRIILASFATYLITQLVDIYLYGYLKHQTSGKYFVLRNYISLCISQFLDTILFSFLGLYGIVANITDIIFISYSIKIAAIILMTPFLLITKKLLKK